MRAVSLLALIAFATPAIAQDNATPAPQPEKKICRAAPSTGSILRGKRECRTKAEWAAITASSQDARDKQDRDLRGRGGNTGITRPSN